MNSGYVLPVDTLVVYWQNMILADIKLVLLKLMATRLYQVTGTVAAQFTTTIIQRLPMECGNTTQLHIQVLAQ